MPGRASGSAAIVAAAALWGSTGTVAHFAPGDASPVSVGAARIVLGGAVLVAIAFHSATPPSGSAPSVTRQGVTRLGVTRLGVTRRSAMPPRPPRRGGEIRQLLARRGARRAVLVLGAASTAGYQLSFFSAVRATGVAIGTVVAIGSAPVLTGLISRLTGGGALTRRWMLATAGAIAGCSVLVTGGRAAGANLGGVGLALLAGLCYALYAVTAARLVTGGTSERAVMGVLFGGGAVLLLPVLAVSSPGWLLSGSGLLVSVQLGVLTTAVAYLFYGHGLRTVPAPAAATLGLAEPMVAALLALVVLGERLSGPAIAGLLLVGLALALLVLPGMPGSGAPGPGMPGSGAPGPGMPGRLAPGSGPPDPRDSGPRSARPRRCRYPALGLWRAGRGESPAWEDPGNLSEQAASSRRRSSGRASRASPAGPTSVSRR